MAQYDLYVDMVAGELVRGLAGSAAEFPRLVQGDTISLRIYLLTRTSTYPYTNPFSIISTAGLSLRVGIGTKDGTPGTVLATQQFVWNTDAENQYFYANLPLNTAGIATLLGANPQATTWFEIEMVQAGYPTTVLQKQVTVNAEVIDSAAVTVPAGLTAMSAEEANARFLTREVQGAIILVSPNGLKKAALYLDNDGVVHHDPVN